MRIARIYRGALRRFLKKSFPFWQKFDFHITPNHYYQPIPDTRMLKDDLWQRQSELIGVDINEEDQLKLVSLFSSKFKKEYENFPRNKTSTPYQYYSNNVFLGSTDGEILYCMIRHFKPSKIFEIGSGNSTYLSAQGVIKNKEEDDHYRCELVVMDPHPNDILKAGFQGLSKLISKKVQDIPLSDFRELTENDILFIDSSHVLRIGSDVQYEYLEILPRLNQGVIIHLHDIFLPAEYPKEWVLRDFRFWTEQYLLQAFLAFNDSFKVLWAGSYMHLKHYNILQAAFRSYEKETRWPASFWIKKIK
jgi:hypothetical protein